MVDQMLQVDVETRINGMMNSIVLTEFIIVLLLQLQH